ncbi:MAG: PQQ-dependent sugar dehydrogenase, partial [Myxococcota bacterium]
MATMRRLSLTLLMLMLPLSFAASTANATLPDGFVEGTVGGSFDEPVGVTFDDNGRMYVWERPGRVQIVENGVKLATPLLDIHDEVGAWSDYGMLGFALDPNFLSNGYFYVLYVVDHYFLVNGGLPGYDPLADEYNRATIVRLTRYTANPANALRTALPASRLVLLGESASTGCPILHTSHGAGSLRFGMDGTLLATCGDGASWEIADGGGDVGGSHATQAFNEGIITAAENVGAFRAQLLSSLSGKILRLDPATGDGVPSNPWYDAANPRAPRSRVWALGLRNPYRFTVRPESGSHLPSAGDPGSLFLGDVGWDSWEEIEVAATGGINFGWPIFQGLGTSPDYPAITTANPDAPNPLYAPPGCNIPFFRFIDLIKQETLGVPSFPNPC